MNNKFLIKTVVGIVVCAGLMFVLNCFASIDTGVPNTYVSFGFGILAAGAAIFGPIAGFLIGFIGHTLVDIVATQIDPGWGGVSWSWVISSAIYGCAIGAFWKSYKVEAGQFGLKECFVFNGVQVVAGIAVWVFLARTLDMIINNEAFDRVTPQSFTAAGTNIVVVLVLGSLLTWGYSMTMIKRKG